VDGHDSHEQGRDKIYEYAATRGTTRRWKASWVRRAPTNRPANK
jgi:hypothetical protein